MSENKDNNYADPNSDPLAGKNKVLCFTAVPGVLHQSSELCVQCPSCQHIGKTDVTSGWNIKSYLCCYYYGCCWWCYQLLKGKDFLIKDAIHKCSSCKTTINHYKSCD